MSIETPIEEKIEAARARLKTAHDQMEEAVDKPYWQTYHNKWKQRRQELEILLSQLQPAAWTIQ